MSLFFDRQVDAIEQAVERVGYLFARAEMPWILGGYPSSSDLRSQLIWKAYELNREELPGLMVFRKSQTVEGNQRNWLFVFVVGDTPTGGINKAQFLNALKAIRSIPWNVAQDSMQLFILGPTFSGSLYSLKDLTEVKTERTDESPSLNSFRSILVHSGTVSSYDTIHWFTQQKSKQVTFRTFQESDKYELNRLTDFACQQGYSAKDITVLSEDETAYGAATRLADDQTTPTEMPPLSCGAAPQCKPSDYRRTHDCTDQSDVVHLYFPREISHLRSAYQRNLQEQTSPTDVVNHAVRAALRLNLEDANMEGDTVPDYSPVQTPISQESILMSIVSSLLKHHARFVVIQATNPLDTIFLSRYLRSAYPDGRIITVGADLLFQHEGDDPHLQGVLAVTPYSLLPAIGDDVARSQQPSEGIHADLIFPSSDSVGTFNAVLSLLTCQESHSDCSIPSTLGAGSPIGCAPSRVGHEYPDLVVAPYEQYGWPGLGGDSDSARCVLAPPLWLTVLGRNGYWPLSLLDSARYTEKSPHLESDLHAVNAAAQYKPFRSDVPLSWKVLCFSFIIFTICYVFLLRNGSIISTSETVANFAPVNYPWRNRILFFADSLFLLIGYFLLLPWFRWTTTFGDLWVACALLVTFILSVVIFSEDLRARGSRELAICVQWIGITLAVLAVVSHYISGIAKAASVNLFLYRCVHLTSGVSWIVPLLFLLAASGWWTWYTLAGMALMDHRAPRIPRRTDLGKRHGELPLSATARSQLGSLTYESNDSLPRILQPVSWDIRLYMVPALLIFLILANMDLLHPVQSLEGKEFDLVYFVALLLVLWMLLFELFRLVVGWIEFRHLLASLDRLPLRRGFHLLKGFTWRPIWRFGGSSIVDVYRLVSRELETLVRLKNALLPTDPFREVVEITERRVTAIAQRFTAARKGLVRLNPRELVYSLRPNIFRQRAERMNKAAQILQQLQETLASTCGMALVYLDSQWRIEKDPIYCDSPEPKDKVIDQAAAQALSLQTQLAEQFVCLFYLNYILSVFTKMRTVALIIAGIYVFVLLSFNSYPFEPKTSFNMLMLFLFALILALVGFVFAQMHRDATLSRITDTTPGELGIDFWLRLIAFTTLPLFSLLAAQLPEINNFLFSWLQPALAAFK